MRPVHESYPTELDGVFALADRTVIRVRALRRCEDAPIRELFDHLSPRSRYLRFLSPLTLLPDALVERLSAVDYRRNVALVAEHAVDGGQEVVGLGSFGAVDDEHVEVALAVRDDWQRRRIGTELATRVIDAAEARGFHRFVATFTADNWPIRRVLNTVGQFVSGTTSAGTSEVIFVRRAAR